MKQTSYLKWNNQPTVRLITARKLVSADPEFKKMSHKYQLHSISLWSQGVLITVEVSILLQRVWTDAQTSQREIKILSGRCSVLSQKRVWCESENKSVPPQQTFGIFCYQSRLDKRICFIIFFFSCIIKSQTNTQSKSVEQSEQSDFWA